MWNCMTYQVELAEAQVSTFKESKCAWPLWDDGHYERK